MINTINTPIYWSWSLTNQYSHIYKCAIDIFNLLTEKPNTTSDLYRLLTWFKVLRIFFSPPIFQRKKKRSTWFQLHRQTKNQLHNWINLRTKNLNAILYTHSIAWINATPAAIESKSNHFASICKCVNARIL